MPGTFQDLRDGLRAPVGHPGLTAATAVSVNVAISEAAETLQTHTSRA
jgi:hypothetical protein